MRPDYGVSHMANAIHFAYGRCMVPPMATIGERIRDRRKAMNLRQGDLAVRIGLDQSTISDIERGQGFGADVLMRICAELRTDPYFVMNGVEGSTRIGLHSDTIRDDGGSSDAEMGYGVKSREPLPTTIPNSMPLSAPNLKSAILLMGSLVGALDKRRRNLVRQLLGDLVDHVDERDEVEDIAETAFGIALRQKPITKNKALDKALRGRGEDAVETGPAPLEH